MSKVDARNLIVDRLVEDIHGPRDSIEVLPFRSSPRDQYLTGVLYPQGTAEDEDECDTYAEEGQKSENNGSDQDESIIASKTWLPSSMGISFQIRPENKSEFEVNLRITAGLYRLKPRESIDPDPGDGSEEYWAREQLDSGDVRVRVTGASAEYPADLGAHGLTGLRLFLQVREHNDSVHLTVCLINSYQDKDLDFQDRNEKCFFQTHLAASVDGGDQFVPRKISLAGNDRDQDLNALLYRNVHEYATGHTCSATWNDHDASIREVSTQWLPRQRVDDVDPAGDPSIIDELAKIGQTAFSAETLAGASSNEVIEILKVIPDTYSEWLGKVTTEELESIPPNLRTIAAEQIQSGESACQRMSQSIELIKNDPQIFEAFTLANKAMTLQASWQGYRLDWRPFQLGFALLVLASLATRNADRDIMDLLWFPTGGGKTEAYLLLVAFILFYRRLERGSLAEDDGVAVLTRYTLRALTTDQFQRAVTLVCACEAVRRRELAPAIAGEPFAIGLWIGQSATPNKFDAAKVALETGAQPSPKMLDNCPCCGGELNWRANEAKEEIEVTCGTENCELGQWDIPLPVHTVDSQIYKRRPSIVIGTVDKFVQLCRFPTQTDSLFNRDTDFLPPDLIIQDELHLISGPLGTMTGLLELSVDWICTNGNIKPKIVGSTATIQRAADQVLGLFDRDVFQFPPPIVDAGNSFFARRDTQSSGRDYLGITTAGRTPTYMLQAMCGSLIQAVSDNSLQSHPDGADPYTTLAVYFNSLRILGGARTLLWEDAQKSKSVFAALRGEAPRDVRDLQELTSHVSQEELKQTLARLKCPLTHPDHIDLLLASVMLSVGVDIPRLGLMIVDGQPKTMAEYIQATSRVGRNEIPGLIVTLFNNGKARDRSHFETFKTWHSAFYRHVEATGVTPFAPRARDKALSTLLVALAARVTNLTERDAELTADRRLKIEEIVVPEILRRVSRIDKRETDDCAAEIDTFLDEWESRGRLKFLWNDYKPEQSLFVSAERAAQGKAGGGFNISDFAAPNSVRDVEPSVDIKVRDGRLIWDK